MNSEHESILKQIDSLKYNIQDAIDHPEDPQARALRQDIQDLISDLRTNKNLRDIENSIKVMQGRLRQAHSNPGNGFMSVEHADYFHHVFEDMRMNIRRLPDY